MIREGKWYSGNVLRLLSLAGNAAARYPGSSPPQNRGLSHTELCEYGVIIRHDRIQFSSSATIQAKKGATPAERV
ncbi:hypothetical protein F5Y11DRAFT_329427 [Daldinia sp. FL1419]|nr:hypothetical protein F5Y11DRAFT_329427 [Daldinia sp. FL1419]